MLLTINDQQHNESAVNKLLNTIVILFVCLLSGCSKAPKESMEVTIVAIQEGVYQCIKEDQVQTTVKAANGHVKKYCGLFGNVGGKFNAYWQDGNGITLN